MKKRHGGDIEGFIENYGREPLDFSTNLGLGVIPESVRQAVEKALQNMDRYPDPESRRLRGKIAEIHNTKTEYILCGNGAADLIYRFCYAIKPQIALIPSPSFSEYEEAMEAAGARVVRHLLKEEENFVLQEDFLEKITSEIDAIFLCEPGNPTGMITDKELLIRIVQKAASCGCYVFLDECFNEFLEAGDEHSLISTESLEAYGNLVVLKSFTKVFRMPGARLGFVLSSNVKLLESMKKAGQSWPVSVFAEEIGLAYLSEDGFADRAVKPLRAERERVRNALTELGFRVIPGRANYLLFKGPEGLWNSLAEKGILIRNCSNFDGLCEGWYRIGIRDQETNDILLEAIRDGRES